MEIKTAEFVKSTASLAELPPQNYPEYAFVGRSNVGKSSLINALCGRKSLARTSSTPGKTQLINHFMINNSWYIVDLPGYGYAKVSKKIRKNFQSMITYYVEQRRSLMNVFVLVDSRIKPQKIDLEFMTYLGEKGIPFSVVFTKIDKPSQKELGKNIKNYKAALAEIWDPLPHILYTSAEKGKGTEELLEFIEEINPGFVQPEKEN